MISKYLIFLPSLFACVFISFIWVNYLNLLIYMHVYGVVNFAGRIENRIIYFINLQMIELGTGFEWQIKRIMKFHFFKLIYANRLLDMDLCERKKNYNIGKADALSTICVLNMIGHGSSKMDHNRILYIFVHEIFSKLNWMLHAQRLEWERDPYVQHFTNIYLLQCNIQWLQLK